MKRVDRISAAVLLIFGLAAAFESYRLGLTRSGILGPGVFPLLSTSTIVLLSLLLMWNSRGTDIRGSLVVPSREQLKVTASFFVGVILFVVLTQAIGFFVATMLFVGGLMRYPGRYSWRAVVAVSLSVTLFVYLVLGKFLGVPLPPGILTRFGL